MEKSMEKENKKRKIFIFFITLLIIILILILFIPLLYAQEVKVCSEKTKAGAWCQNELEEKCDLNYRSAPTSCASTSFCRQGCCYDSTDGICMENTAQRVCDENEGTWADSPSCNIPQCNLGCCVLGKQASFVTLTRCKKLSGFYGLLTDFRKEITSELECISLASLADEGACVIEIDYAKSCKFTSRQECNTIKEGAKTETGTITKKVEFYRDYLCSAEELGTNCGPTKKTSCIEGKDEVHYIDSCGNPANISDAGKADDKAYWRKKISKAESCNSEKDNINSRTCGNCNYFEGSICKDYKKTGLMPTYGNYICSDLDCPAEKTTDGNEHKHGESWCSTDEYGDSVGSRYFRHICINGEETIEPCADFRQEICIEDKIETNEGDFSQAACRVNRWQDCVSQKLKKDCENTDKRDCKWIDARDSVENSTIACVPEHPPGIEFWNEGEAQGICSVSNNQCIQKWEKGLIEDKECKGECCGDKKALWIQSQLTKCQAVSDCGAKTNFLGILGNKDGYDITEKKV